MSHKSFWRRYAVVAAVLVPWAVLLTHTFAQGKKSGIKPPEDASDEVSAEARRLTEKPDLAAALDTDVYKRLKMHLPKVRLTPRIEGATDKKDDSAGPEVFVAEGDLPLDDAQLRFFAKTWADKEAQFLAALNAVGPAQPEPEHKIVLHVVFGQKRHWIPGSTVKYCIQKRTFTEAQYEDMKTRMKDATGAWEAACNINFEHAEDKDDTVPEVTPPQGVTFTVRRAAQPSGSTLALAFFPGDPGPNRHIWLFPSFYGAHGFDRTGILRHELGHTLGFRHEFSQPGTPPNACQREQLGEGIPLTPPDAQSVMQYFCPQAGLGSKTMRLTDLDRLGARKVYGAPKD
jgi:hypothetical protein